MLQHFAYLQILCPFSAHLSAVSGTEFTNYPNLFLLFSRHFLKYEVKEMLQPFQLTPKSAIFGSGGRQHNN